LALKVSRYQKIPFSVIDKMASKSLILYELKNKKKDKKVPKIKYYLINEIVVKKIE